MITKQDKNSIKDMFNSIAKDYDLLNNIISFGLNVFVKNKSISNLKIKNGETIVDLCTGTGDIAMILARKYPESKIIAVDFSKEMLKIAKKRAKKYKNIEFIEGDVSALPFSDNEFDVCTISFGLRNLPNVEKAIFEMMRVIKPGGIASSLDLGRPNWFFNIFFDPYFKHIMPLLAKFVNKNSDPYEYLYRSNKDFPPQKKLVGIFKSAGFSPVKNHNFAFGSIAQQIAQKPTVKECEQ